MHGRSGGALGFGNRVHVDKAAIEYRLDLGEPLRFFSDTHDPDMGIARLAIGHGVVIERCRRQGEIAPSPGEFLKTPAALRRPRRQAEFNNDFLGPERRRQRSEEEVGGPNHASPSGADGRDLSLAGHHDARQLGSWIGVSKAAADGAAIANLIMGYMFE